MQGPQSEWLEQYYNIQSNSVNFNGVRGRVKYINKNIRYRRNLNRSRWFGLVNI